MAQPTGQVNLGAAYASEYFWYAQGSGLWNARSGSAAAKTGSGAVVSEGGANVIQTNGTTYFTLASKIVLSGQFTIGFKARLTAANNSSMIFGDTSVTSDFLWLNNGAGQMSVRANGNTQNRNYSGSATMHTIHIVRENLATLPKLYIDGVLDGTFPQILNTTLTIGNILTGYSGGAYALNGVLEYLSIIDGTALDAAGVASRAADPYQILDVGGASNIAASGGAVASGTATGSMSATAGNISASGGAVASGTATGTMSAAGSGTITIPAVRDWSTGNLKAGASGVQVDIHSISTGALVVRKTGQTTHGTTGVCTVTDALIAPGTTYEVVTRFADGSLGVWDYAAT